MNRSKALIQPLLLAGVLAIGAGAAWATLTTWSTGFVQRMSSNDAVYESVWFQTNGTPVIRAYTIRGGVGYENYRTLSGSEVAEEDVSGTLQGAELQAREFQPKPFGRIDWRLRIQGFLDNSKPPVYWYFVHSGRRSGSGYFVGYDSEAKLCIGYLGRSGFSLVKPPPEDCFPIECRKEGYGHAFSNLSYASGQEAQLSVVYRQSGTLPIWLAYFLSEDRLLEADLDQRRVRVVLEEKGLISVKTLMRAVSSAGEESSRNPESMRQYLAIRKPEEVVVVDPKSGDLRRYPLPVELREGRFTFFEMADGSAVVQSSLDRRNGTSEETLTWIDLEGTSLRRETFVLQKGAPPLSATAQANLLALGIPAPIAVTVAATIFSPLQYVEWGQEPDYPSALARSFWEFSPALLVTYLLAALLAALAYQRHRRYALPWARTWAVFVLIFGVPGLIGYLFHRRWPVRESCPACGHSAPRDRRTCTACERAFPEPALSGTEVFV